jgi:small subunit ribosomal protein S3Ae
MAKGKNKLQSKRGGGRGKTERHAFFKKQWFKLNSPPSIANSVQVGWTPVNKTMGTKLSKDGLMGRVAEVSFGDINEQTQFAWKKVKMQVEEVKGSALYTSFYGINIIKEKLYNYLRKKMSLIDVVCDVKTSDGYILRVLITTFTARKAGQCKNNTYAKHSQIRAIRKTFVKAVAKRAINSTAGDFAQNVINEVVSKQLLERGSKIYPLSQVLIRKVKVLKKSKIDVNKLVTETNTKRDESKAPAGKGVENVAAEATEAKNLLDA